MPAGVLASKARLRSAGLSAVVSLSERAASARRESGLPAVVSLSAARGPPTRRFAATPAGSLRVTRERRLVPELGIEPTLPEGNGILRPAKWVDGPGQNRSRTAGRDWPRTGLVARSHARCGRVGGALVNLDVASETVDLVVAFGSAAIGPCLGFAVLLPPAPFLFLGFHRPVSAAAATVPAEFHHPAFDDRFEDDRTSGGARRTVCRDEKFEHGTCAGVQAPVLFRCATSLRSTQHRSALLRRR